MKGIKGVDPTKEPNDIIVALAFIGWLFAIIGGIDVLIRAIERLWQ